MEISVLLRMAEDAAQGQQPPVSRDPNQLLSQMMNLLAQNFMGMGETCSDTQWKMRFHEVLKKKGIDEKPTYLAMPNTGGAGFLGTVTVNGQHYVNEEAVKSKKEAEQAAAKAAFESLYPEEFNQSSAGGGFHPAMMQAMSGMFGGRPGKGQKRKEWKAQPTEMSAKCKLGHGVQLLIKNASGRNMTAQDILYTFTENEGPPKTYMATVTIVEYEGGKSFCGDWCETQPKAAQSAAQVAYDSMSVMFEALEEAHAAQKEARQRQMREATNAKRKADRKANKHAVLTPEALTDA